MEKYEIFKVLSDKNRFNIFNIISKYDEILKVIEGNLKVEQKTSCDCGGNC